MTPAQRYEGIIGNLRFLAGKGASNEELNQYLNYEGLTFQDLETLLEGPSLFGQAKETLKGLPAGAVGLVEQAAIGASALLPEDMEAGAREVIESTATAARRPFAPAVGYEETVGRKLGEAGGSFAPFLATLPFGLPGVAAALGLGVGAGAGEARTRAEQEGATEEQRATATALGTIPGALELFAPFRILRRIPEGEVISGVERVKRAFIAGGEEGAQEAASAVAQNLIAREVYKPEQQLVEGVGEQAAYGGAVGAIAQGLFDLAIPGKQRGAAPSPTQTTTPTEPAPTPVGVPAEAQQLGLFPEEEIPVALTPDEGVYAMREESMLDEARRQQALVDADELRGTFDILQRENERLAAQFERATTDEERAEVKKKAEELAPQLEQIKSELQKVERKLPKEERGRTEAAPEQMALDFEAPLMERQKTGEGVVLGETPEAPPQGLTPEQQTFFDESKLNAIRQRIEDGQPVTDADRARLRLAESQQQLDFEAAPTPGLVVPEERPEARPPFGLQRTDIEQPSAAPREPITVTPEGEAITERPDALQSEFDQLTDRLERIKDEEKSAEIEQERAAIQDRLTEINDTLKTLGAEARRVSENDFTQMGIGRTNKKLREQLIGKDLADPAQREEVRATLEDFANAPNRSEKLRTGVENFLSQPMFMEQMDLDLRARRKPRVRKPTEPVGQRGEPSVSPPSGEEAAPSGIGAFVAERMGAPVDVSGLFDAGEGVQQPAMRQEFLNSARRTFNRLRDPGTASWRELTFEQQMEFLDEFEKARPNIPRYRLAEASTEGMPVEKVKKLVERLTGKWKNAPKITVVQSVNELTRYGLEGVVPNAKGLFDPNTQAVFLIADNITGYSDALLTVAHESIGHFGLQAVLGDTYSQTMNRLYQNPDVKKAADAKMKADPELTRELAVEEVIAEAVERKLVPKSAMAKAVATLRSMIRNFLNKLGVAASNSEIDSLIAQAANYVVDGVGGAPTRLRPIEDLFKDIDKYKTVDYKGKEKLIRMHPNDFLRLAKSGKDEEKTEGVSKIIESGKQFSSVPWLSFNTWSGDNPTGVAQVTGHEGRHRARKLLEMGYTEMPVLLRSDIRWSEQNDPTKVDYQAEWPERLRAEEGYGSLEFPVPREEAATNYDDLRSDWYKEVKALKDSLANLTGEELEIAKRRFERERNKYMSSESTQAEIARIRKQNTAKQRIRYRKAATVTPEGQDALNTIEQMGRKYEPPKKDFFGRTKQDDSKISQESSRGAVTKFLDQVQTWTFSTDAALNNEIRRRIDEDTKENKDKIGTLINISMSQTVHDDALGNLILTHGKLEFDPETYKYVAVDDRNNFVTLASQIQGIASQYGLTVDQTEALGHIAFEARRLKGLREYNTRVMAEVEKLNSQNRKAAAERRAQDVKFIHMTDQQIDTGMTLFDKMPELNQLVDTWNGMRANTRDVMVQSGLWSPEEAESLLANADYVPFTREEQIEEGKGPKEFLTGLQVNAREKKLKGTLDPVNDVFDNMARWTQYAVKRAVRNRNAVSLVDTAVENGLAKKVDGPSRGGNTVKIWRDGVEEFYDMADPLYMEAFRGLESVGIPTLRLMAKFANFLRQSVVLYPLFSVAQVPQDAFAAMFSSGLKTRQALTIPARVVKEYIKTLAGSSRTNAELRRYGVVGVRDFTSAVARMDAEIYSGLKQQTGMKGIWEGVKRKLEHIAMASDNAVRQAVYEAAMDQGLTKAEALEKAFEIINFRRRGSSKALGIAAQVIPFFNAYLSAQNVAIRTISGVGISPGDRAAALRTLAVTTGSVMALSLIYAMMISDDEDYQNKPSVIRDRLLMIPGTGGLSVPIRPDVFSLPKILTEHTYLMMTDDGTQDGRKFRDSMSAAVVNAISSPTAIPQIIKPFFEVGINYNFFQGRPLVGMYQQNLELGRQFNDSTSEFAKALGSTNLVSPIAVDHIIRGMFGTTGGLFLYMTNGILQNDPSAPRPELSFQDAIATFPGMSPFVSREDGTALKNDFYVLREEVDKAVDTFNDLKRRSPQDVLEYLADEKKINRLGMSRAVNAISNQLGEIRRAVSQVTNAPGLNAQQKREMIKQLRDVERQILKTVDLKELRRLAQL